MSYSEGDMDLSPEYRTSKENPHRDFLIKRNLGQLKKVRSGEITPQQLAEEWADRETALEERATRDPLTGLLNLKGFTDILDEDLLILQQYGVPAYLAFFDGDKLKELNDTVGKLEGNKAIQSYAEVLRQLEISHPNIPFLMGRFGGDEFMLLIIGSDIKEASSIFEEIRESIPNAVRMNLGMPELQSTVSMGVARVRPEDNTNTLLQRADNQLKIAKMSRNKVVFEDFPSTLIHK